MSIAEDIGFSKAPGRTPRRALRDVVHDLPPGEVRLCVGCGYMMRTDRELCEHCIVWGDSAPAWTDEVRVPDSFPDCTQCGRQRWTDDTPVCHHCHPNGL